MENLFRANSLRSVVEIGFSKRVEGTMVTEAQKSHLDDARLKDHHVTHYLFQEIDRTVFEQTLDVTKIVGDSIKRSLVETKK